MTVEQLLQPRVILTANFPGNIDPVGKVYTLDMEDGYDIDFYETCKECPANFRVLEWWEERQPEDMMSVEFVRIVKYSRYWTVGDIVPVISFTVIQDKPYGYILKYNHWQPVFELLPATKEEYDNFVNNKTQ